jgi:hypothetical protein
MPGCKLSAGVLSAVTFAAALGSAQQPGSAKPSNTVSGIVTEKDDSSITVRADGEKDPVKYLVGDKPAPAVAPALKEIFTAGRVKLTYKMAGDERQLVTIQKVVLRTNGTFAGEVLYTHPEGWVEVKPRTGPPEGFCVNYPADKDKSMQEKVKSLKEGDLVTITFFTDIERHRIVTLQKTGEKKKDK